MLSHSERQGLRDGPEGMQAVVREGCLRYAAEDEGGSIDVSAHDPVTEEDGALTDAGYRELAALLRFVATRKFGIPDDDADELVSGVFLTYLTQRPQVRNLRAYLIGGICNASREHWRSRKRAEAVFAPLGEEPTSPDDLLERIVRDVTLGATLARLRRQCRSILKRYYFEHASTKDIARDFGTTENNVLKLLHRCRNRARMIFRTLHGPRV